MNKIGIGTCVKFKAMRKDGKEIIANGVVVEIVKNKYTVTYSHPAGANSFDFEITKNQIIEIMDNL